MNKEMNCCPVCNARLSPIGGFLLCPKHCKWAGTKELWQELIKTQKKLDIAMDGLDSIRISSEGSIEFNASQFRWAQAFAIDAIDRVRKLDNQKDTE